MENKKTSINNRIIHVGKIYKHYKGKEYKIIAIAYDSENSDIKRVIYQSLYDCPIFGSNAIWDRPYDMFVEDVFIDGKQQSRFKEVI